MTAKQVTRLQRNYERARNRYTVAEARLKSAHLIIETYQKTVKILSGSLEAMATKPAPLPEFQHFPAGSQGAIHPGANIGVMIEVTCETDFSANTNDMKNFAHDVCLHIAATNPIALDSSSLDPALLAHEESIFREQLKESSKPSKIIDKIVEGKLASFCKETCLLDQPFVKNDKITIQAYLNELIAKIGENIKIKRFVRYQLGT